MPTEHTDIETRIIEMIADQSAFNPDKISLRDNVKDDLGLDSLDCIELTIALEEEFQIDIPDEKIDSLLTVNQIIEYVKNHA